jgi:hypothetical protein
MKTKRVLHMNLHREFFAAIIAGTKRMEYRDHSPHWRSRLEDREYDVIQFRNGYARNAPVMVVEFRGVGQEGRGNSAKYAIRLGRILSLKRWRG